jgi:hypothetical protein
MKRKRKTGVMLAREAGIPAGRAFQGERVINATLWNVARALRWLEPRLRWRGLEDGAECCRWDVGCYARLAREHAEYVAANLHATDKR